jgi:serine kinase of HPr protein (carbohydrate metabolism regulator)
MKGSTVHHPSLPLAHLFDEFASLLQWQWLKPPASASDTLCASNPALSFIGHFNAQQGHLVTVLEDLSQLPKHSSPEKLLIVAATHPPLAAEIMKTQLPLLYSPLVSTAVVNHLAPYLYQKLSPQLVVHGVYLDIFGKGVLLCGPSGCGKSRLAMQLLARGHRLIADDAPLFSVYSPQQLIGRCPPELQNLIEVRPLGILDVTSIFGPLSVTAEKPLDLIINLSNSNVAPQTRLLKPDLVQKKLFHHVIPCLNLSFAFGEDSAMLIENAVKVVFAPVSASSLS